MNVAGNIPTDGLGTNFDTGLRQRRVGPPAVTATEDGPSSNTNTDNEGRQVQGPRPPPLPPRARRPFPGPNQPGMDAQQQQHPWRTSHVYCFVSAILAVLAIVTSSAIPATGLASRNFTGKEGVTGSETLIEINASPPSATDADLITTNPVPSSYMIDALDTEWWRDAMKLLFPARHIPTWFMDDSGRAAAKREKMLQKWQQHQLEQQLQKQQNQQPWWKPSRLVPSQKHPFEATPAKQQNEALQAQAQQHQALASGNSTSWWQSWVDPSLLQGQASALTDIIDKVSNSTPRLLAIANLLLALTYQMHTAVADWFLGAGVYPPPGEWAMTGRERLGSFLVFKLLLISAVAEPDTLDLLILLSWYTLLSFLRSLAHLAAATTSHTTQSGQPPRTGVLQLLLVVLLCDFVAAAVCFALFQLAGPGKVFLLTCDCALLAVEVIGHILKHGRQVLEDMHEHTIGEMEEQQLQIHTRQRRLEERAQRLQQHEDQDEAAHQAREASAGGGGGGDVNANDAGHSDGAHAGETVNMMVATITNSGNEVGTEANQEGWDDLDDMSLDGNGDDDDDGITIHRNDHRLLMEDARRLDQAMDALEVAHARRLAILDTTIFALQLLVHFITVGHFLHIWCLHGIQFTLIDGVLALHLHSALSAASKQIAGRRNLHRIARNLDGMFPNASELDLKKAHAVGDVCCICLGAMSVGSVKKVGCGHLYHTNCLREVIERAISIEAAKCPLCRANIVDGSHPGTNSNTNGQDQNGGAAGGNDNTDNNGGNGAGNNPDNDQRIVRPNDGMNHRGERALFRFSTEGILPTWMPLPAFSFEVVRRPTRQEQPAQVVNNTANNVAAAVVRAPQMTTANANNGPRNQNSNTQQSFLRRLLLLAGAVPMSPEEEARALAQLVDMFPQYDRSDLLRELRDRGSAESVVESVLLGVFSGRVRGSAGGEATPATANNPAAAETEPGNESPAVAEATLPTVMPEEEAQLQLDETAATDVLPALEVAARI